jgi:hypothetical protein
LHRNISLSVSSFLCFVIADKCDSLFGVCGLMQGGGWCNTIKNCVYRKTTRRGSSKLFEKQLPFTGILSDKAEENPGFFPT